MPRGRCHLAVLSALHQRLRIRHRDIAALADRCLPDFIGGAVAPDGLRYVGRLGKRATHFYTEDEPETWGQSVAGLLRAHPELADPDRLREPDRVLVMGYISHLTVDEAFRDVVTCQLHGTADWRPTVQGLWSLVDELPVGYSDAPAEVERFCRKGRVGLIDRGMVGEFLDTIRPWVMEDDPLAVEQAFLEMIRRPMSEEAAWQQLEAKRKRAAALMDDARRAAFVREAVRMGMVEIVRYLEGGYCG